MVITFKNAWYAVGWAHTLWLVTVKCCWNRNHTKEV